MVMEFLSGPTLKTVLTTVVPQSGPLSLPIVINIMSQIADALDYAHCEGLVHRDVKPANVMLRPPRPRSSTGSLPPGTAPTVAETPDALFQLVQNLGSSDVVLTDFGVARIVNDTNQHTVTGTILGSPAYMSPEQGAVSTSIVDLISIRSAWSFTRWSLDVFPLMPIRPLRLC
ncbi:MAG: protein kinase [Chloroflexaceae bacterium]|nr:protein kinase [Chloroflexaceae bacterium]